MDTGKNILSEDIACQISESLNIEPEFRDGKLTSFSICQNPAYRVLSNSYYGMCVNDGTTIEKRARKIYRDLIINMRNKDLYDAYHKYDQVIFGCTRNTKFDWKLDTLAKMAYYGFDANKFLFLQTMRYPRASKSWLMISSYIKNQQLMKDLGNHTLDLHNVVYWETLNDGPNYLEGLEVRDVSSAPLRYIQALQCWDETSRIDEQMASLYNEFHNQFINKNSNNRADMKTDWLKRKTK